MRSNITSLSGNSKVSPTLEMLKWQVWGFPSQTHFSKFQQNAHPPLLGTRWARSGHTWGPAVERCFAPQERGWDILVEKGYSMHVLFCITCIYKCMYIYSKNVFIVIIIIIIIRCVSIYISCIHIYEYIGYIHTHIICMYSICVVL